MYPTPHVQTLLSFIMSQTASSTASIREKDDQIPHSDIEQPMAPMDDKELDTPTPTAINPFDPSQFPDGGKDAYLCLLGAFCCLFCSFGWLNALGVFQSYYQRNQLREYSPSTVSWISSLELFVMFFPGPIVGFMYDSHGPKYLLFIGTFFHVFGLMMTSLCSEYWQFILAQGICSPLGLNCIFQAGTSALPTWFFKKRGLAYGAMAAGSGLGGIIFPIMASHLIPKVGFAWAMRAIAFLILGMMSIAALTVKSRLPPTPRAFELKIFIEPYRDINFVLLAAASFIFFMGIFIPINFIEVQAMANGMSDHLASYLLAVLNAASIFGRVIPGALADKVGKYNLQAFMGFVSAILVLTLGVTGSSNVASIAFAGFYGFSSGAWVSLLPAQIASISKVEQIGTRIGVIFASMSFAALIGNPVAGQIIIKNKGKFWGMNVFAGVILVTGASTYLVARMQLAKWKLAVKV
ncbi:monocarboxylate permease [Pyrenophora seminiperda CCB06]|uniref:Monocarboxylate permease n=1 Tax=Pyrenophora seminiperda CCB06 TaxID=1302712 RepID=A0A3M7MCM4_9PLEO|nr:monocarboxylate permease [Pyrenophora seminiperda CCB06]